MKIITRQYFQNSEPPKWKVFLFSANKQQFALCCQIVVERCYLMFLVDEHEKQPDNRYQPNVGDPTIELPTSRDGASPPPKRQRSTHRDNQCDDDDEKTRVAGRPTLDGPHFTMEHEERGCACFFPTTLAATDVQYHEAGRQDRYLHQGDTQDASGQHSSDTRDAEHAEAGANPHPVPRIPAPPNDLVRSVSEGWEYDVCYRGMFDIPANPKRNPKRKWS